jgi:hypothetical protein
MRRAIEAYEEFVDQAIVYLCPSMAFGDLLTRVRALPAYRTMTLLVRNSSSASNVVQEEIDILLKLAKEEEEEDYDTCGDTDLLLFATLLLLIDARDPAANMLSRAASRVPSATWTQCLCASYGLRQELRRAE